MITKVLIVGGANGIGLSIAQEFVHKIECKKIYIVDKSPLDKRFAHEKISSFQFDLTNDNYSFFNQFMDIDAIMITAGFGKLALFKDINEKYIIDSFNVNTLASIRLIKHFYQKIQTNKNFYCGVMVSIAGFMSSPLFSVYGATKAALKIFIESVNIELKKTGSNNCILNVSPGYIKGTNFNNKGTDLTLTAPLAKEIILHLENKDDLYIPQYEEIFKEVLNRYYQDFRAEGEHSFDYKIKSGRI